jgi:spectinomycin phosphotransferase
VRTEPPDLDRPGLARLLEREWSFRAASLEYLPIGFGSHHWEASDPQGARRFVTADRLTNSRAGAEPGAALAVFDRAFRTAAVLRDTAGLEFVIGPLTDRTGGFTHRLGDYAVTLFPFLTAESTDADRSADEQAGVLRMLGRLHAATETLPPDLAPREDFEIPRRHTLVEALGDLDRQWTAGPFGEPARKLLRSSGETVARQLDSYDELASLVRRTSESWVVTHGEPHSSNVLRDGRGCLSLVDWDTVMVSPRERDLWMALDPNASGWSDYLSTAGSCVLDDRALRLYRSRWDLADIAEFVNVFRHAHEETADTIAALGYLESYL